ncbi:MAG: PAS-domain containing protein [Alphaproteobacteria bacterium]|nr:PAS-domain containing protein [Alphaproteobacteria bacterium]
MLVTVLLLAAVYGGNALIIDHYYSAVSLRERAMRDTRAELLAEHAGRALAAVDLSLETIADALKVQLPLGQPTVFTQVLLHKYLKQLPQVRTLAVIGPDGRLVDTTHTFPPPPVNLADRPYFVVQKKWRGVGVYIGPVEISRVDHKPFFGISRPILDEYGNFEGIVLALADPPYFATYYSAGGADISDGAVLERDDGSVLVDGDKTSLNEVRRYSSGGAVPTNVSVRQVHGFPLKIVLIGKPVISSPQFITLISLDAGLLIIMTVIALWLATRAAREASAVDHEARARRKAEARLLSAIDSAPAAVALYDDTDHLVLSNNLYASFFEPVKDLIVPGTSFKELVDAAVTRRAYADQYLDDPDFLRWRIEHHHARDREFLIQLRNGRWVLVRERRTTDDDTVMFFTDVTLLKEREEELNRLNQEQKLFVDALDQIPSGLLLCDAEDRIVICNSANRSYFRGVDAFLAPGTRFETLLRAHAASGYVKDVGDINAWLAKRMAQHRSGNTDFVRTYEDGRWSQIIERRTASGGIIGIRSDITELMRTEEALRQSERAAWIARDEAEQANRAKTAFLANMSHELRTPLNAIIGFSEMIEQAIRGPIAEPYRKYGEIVRTSGQHLLAIINDLLDIAKLNAGKTELHLEPVDINENITNAVSIVSPRAACAKVEIAAILDRECPPIEADPLRLRQVLLNLLINAIKFTPAGGRVDVSTSVRSEELQIVVRDTGMGMAPEDIPRALEPFTQVGKDKHRTVDGTGLGLPISKKLIELHGGRFEITSILNVGTTVTVSLPIRRAAQPSEAKPFLGSAA